MNKDFEQYYNRVRNRQKRDSALVTLILLIGYFGSAHYTEFSWITLIDRMPHFFDYINETLPVLHWNTLFDGAKDGSLVKGSFAYWGYRLHIQLPLIWDTLNMALAATIVGCSGAFVLSFLCAKNTDTPHWLRRTVLFLVAFFRTMPEFAWAVMFVMAFGIGVLPGFLALAFHAMGCNTKLFYEAIESASLKPVIGLQSCGANRLQYLRFALWPQVKPNFISYTFMRFEISFRQSTVLGMVGAGGIGQELMTNIKLDRFDQVSITILLIIIVVIILDAITGKILKHILRGKD